MGWMRLQADAERLRSEGFTVEVIAGPIRAAVTIKDVPLPVRRFTHDRTDVLVLVPAPYPRAALDMFYIRPDVMLRQGLASLPREGQYIHTINGINWRRISWHRNVPWGARDDLITFFEFCRQWFTEVANA